MNRKIYLAPSILSADLLKLKEQVNLVADNGADFIHVDVMDGHFVPNLTFGTGMVKSLKSFVEIPLDVHLMTTNPENYIEEYAKAGANILTVHVEAVTHLHRTIQVIKEHGMKAGVSLNPATPLSTIENVIEDIDLLLIMSVNPGFGGQKFIPQSVKKIQQARQMLDEVNSRAYLEVDGGINVATAQLVTQAGANVLVAGNAIFGNPDFIKAMNEIRNSINS